MTRDEAEQSKKSVFNEFKKVDTNEDGILSMREVVDRRSEPVKRKNIFGNILMGYAIILCITGLMSESKGLTAKMLEATMGDRFKPAIRNLRVETLAISGLSIYQKFRAKHIDKETSEMVQKYYAKEDELKQNSVQNVQETSESVEE